MSRLEKLQRVLAALYGVLISSLWLVGTFRDPDPRAQSLDVILFRVAFSALPLYLFMKRALGRKMDAITWGLFSLWMFEGIWKASTVKGYVVAGICVAL